MTSCLELAHQCARLLTPKPVSIHPGSRDGGGEIPTRHRHRIGEEWIPHDCQELSMLTRTRWSDVLLFTPASCVAMAIVTLHASLASGAALGDVGHAATTVVSGAGCWAAVLEALAIAASGWCALHRRVTVRIRRRDHTVRIGARAW
jgi:hypothetical protein